jgi:hypothetical protein
MGLHLYKFLAESLIFLINLVVGKVDGMGTHIFEVLSLGIELIGAILFKFNVFHFLK